MKHRDQIEVIGQILQVANSDRNATKTRIMYKVLLSYNQLKEHLVFLTEKDLLRPNEKNTRTFRVTDKGLRFLQIYNQINDMIKAPTAATV
jgi:predicted transcriptional regulator